MSEIERIITNQYLEKNPLTGPIRWEEVPTLVKALQMRFGNKGLDLSPGSLKKLEDNLLHYIHSYQEQDKHLTDDEIVQLVREISAYLGYVLVNHAGGEWFQGEINIWDTRVIIIAPWTIIKNRRRFKSTEVNFMITGEAVLSISKAIEGERPKLYRMIRDIKKKILRDM